MKHQITATNRQAVNPFYMLGTSANPINRIYLILILFACVCIPLANLWAQSPPFALEKVFAAGYEDQATPVTPRIEFQSDRVLYFEESGQTRRVAVRVLDANGNVISDPAIEWETENPSALESLQSPPASPT